LADRVTKKMKKNRPKSSPTNIFCPQLGLDSFEILATPCVRESCPKSGSYVFTKSRPNGETWPNLVTLLADLTTRLWIMSARNKAEIVKRVARINAAKKTML
jgi:hypothetical protein